MLIFFRETSSASLGEPKYIGRRFPSHMNQTSSTFLFFDLPEGTLIWRSINISMRVFMHEYKLLAAPILAVQVAYLSVSQVLPGSWWLIELCLDFLRETSSNFLGQPRSDSAQLFSSQATQNDFNAHFFLPECKGIWIFIIISCRRINISAVLMPILAITVTYLSGSRVPPKIKTQ